MRTLLFLGCLVLGATLLEGCGRKTDPVAPLDAPADNVKDLTGRLGCRSVVLRFTAPQKRTDGTVLDYPVRVEVYRRRYKLEAATVTGTPEGTPTPPSPTPSVKSPGAGREPKDIGDLDLPDLDKQGSPAPTPRAAGSPAAEGTPDPNAPEQKTPSPEERLVALVATPTVPPPPTLVPVIPAGEFEKLDHLTISETEVPTPPTPGPGTPAPTPTPMTYKDTGEKDAFELGSTYIYQLVVVDEDGEPSAPSNTTQVEYALIPGAPQTLIGKATASGVVIGWQPPTADCTGEAQVEISGYNVYRRGTEPMFPVAPLNPAPVLTPVFSDATVEMDRTYTYTVRAVATMPPRESEDAKELVVEVFDEYLPAAPAGLVVTRSKDGINLLWNPSPSTDLAGYNVYREVKDGWKKLTAQPQPQTSYLDKEAEPKKVYRYKVTAVDKSIRANESPPTETVQVDEP